MDKEEQYYKELLKRYLEGRCNPKELSEVMDFLEKNASNRLLLLQLREQFYNPVHEDAPINNEQSDRIRNALLQQVTEAPVIPMQRSRGWFMAAAAVLILVGLGSYLFLLNKKGQESHMVQANGKGTRYKNDISPGGNKAVLTLADGSHIVLDEAQNGTLTQQGTTKVIKLGAKVAYNPGAKDTKKVVYNTISTPRGGQYQVELPDNSHVWLNAASSLRFPTAFTGKERRVDVSGEAYFEVAKNKDMPFIVSVDDAEVEVLGTHFNVMAYQEEAAIKTTLLEGSVKFVSGNNSKLLKPGEQSQLTKEGQIKVTNNIDVEEVMAWKNGMFYFDNADLATVMRQLSRWYDVEVVYQNNDVPQQFVGEMSRSSKLSDVLKALELTGKMQFGIEGKKIIVMPKGG